MSDVERRRIILEEIADDPSTPARSRRDALAELAELDATAGRPIFAEEVAGIPDDELAREARMLRRPVRAPEAAWRALHAHVAVTDGDEIAYRVNQLVDERVRAGVEAAVERRTRRLVEEAEAAKREAASARVELEGVRRQFSQALAAGEQPALPPGSVEAVEPVEGLPVPGRRALPPAGATEAGFPREGERRSGILAPFPSRGRSIFRG